MENKIGVICVDDEHIVLTALKDQLMRLYPTEIRLELAESAEEALEIFDEYEADFGELPQVLISDQIMPGMKGDELFQEVSAKYPHTINILLTGQADQDDVISAVNFGNLFRYVEKPWGSEDLQKVVGQALAIAQHQKEGKKGLTANISAELRQGLEKLQEFRSDLESKTKEITNYIGFGRGLFHSNAFKSNSHILNADVSYAPLSRLSGDMYAHVSVSGEDYIMLVDHAGQGIDTATSSIQILALFVQKIEEGLSLIESLAELRIFVREQMSSETNPDRLKCTLVKISEGEIELTGIRSNYLIQNGETLELFKTNQAAFITELNAVPDESTVLEKAKVQSLHLITDGVVEQYGGDAFEAYGFARLSEFIKESSRDFVNHLAAYRDDTPQIDDVLLISLEIE